MGPFLALAAAALLAQPSETAPGRAPAPPQPPIQVEAGTITYDAESDRYELGGGVTLRRGDVTVRGRTARYDAKTGEIDAVGDALLLEPGRVVAADSLHAIVDGPYEARQVVAFFKDRPLDLSSVQTLDEGRRTGRNRMTLRGERITGDQGDRFYADGARITLCDCGLTPPSWEIRASRADVIPEKRAILTWPVIYITPRFLFMNAENAEKMGLLKPVPILPLPWLYVPLAERQTGLLFPELSNTPNTGWAVSQPLFITLGRSWDATVTADYAFGRSEQEVKAGTRGVRGPGTSFELRWAPVEGATGQLRLIDLHDVEHTWVGGVQSADSHGERISLSLRHAQRFSDSTFFAADIGLVNDPLYVSDFTVNVLQRGATYGRSGMALTHRTDDWLLEADAAYHIPLANLGYTTLDTNTGALAGVPYGPFGTDVPVFHRLPAVSATLLPVRLAGPLHLSGSVGIARFAPVHGVTGDEGSSGIGPGDNGYGFVPSPTDGTLDGRWQSGERLAASRLATSLELRAPVAVGGFLNVEPWARARALYYAFESAAQPQADGWLVGGVKLSTQLSRTFGSGTSRLRHVIEPSVEWSWGGLESGPALPAYAYDELDAPRANFGVDPTTFMIDRNTKLPLRPLSAMPPGGFQQLRLVLRNRLIAPSGALSRTLLDLDVGQDFDLMAGSRSETWGSARFGVGRVSGSLLARFYAFGAGPSLPLPLQPTAQEGGSSWLDDFTELRCDLTLSDSRGDNIHGTFLSLGAAASPQTRAGIDALFDPRPIAFAAVAQEVLGVHAVMSGFNGNYDVYIDGRTGHIQEHVVTAVWRSPCNCWNLGVTVTMVPNQGTAFQFLLDLSQYTGGGRFSP